MRASAPRARASAVRRRLTKTRASRPVCGSRFGLAARFMAQRYSLQRLLSRGMLHAAFSAPSVLRSCPSKGKSINTEGTEEHRANRRQRLKLRFPRRADMDFADEASTGLRHERGDRVRDIVRLQDFRGVFAALSGEFRRNRAGADGA